MFLKVLNFPKEMCRVAIKFSLAASGCGTVLVHVVPWIHRISVKGPCNVDASNGLISRMLLVFRYSPKSPPRGHVLAVGSREMGSRGGDILGQEALCWQLGFLGENFQCHSSKAACCRTSSVLLVAVL